MTKLPLTDERIAELARELPVTMPETQRVEAMRTSLLSSVQNPPQLRSRPRWYYIAPALAAAAGLLAYWAVLQQGRSEQTGTQPTIAAETAPRRATVQASQAANFTHKRSGGDEVVALASGSLELRVAGLKTGERFRVVAKHAVVESGAASFKVDVNDEGLHSVRVHSGTVTIRVKGQAAVFLSAGETWRPKLATIHTGLDTLAQPQPDLALQPQPDLEPQPHLALQPDLRPQPIVKPDLAPQRTKQRVPTAKPQPTKQQRSASVVQSRLQTSPAAGAKVTPARQPQPVQPSAAEAEFKTAWIALRANRYRDAAAGFALVIRITSSGTLAPDARYWRAIALMRAGDNVHGQVAAENFLNQHPRSSRVGEISTMVGWLHLKAGRHSAAKKYFQVGITAKRANIRRSAQAGLKALR